ncbi:hypothetical protein DFH09DRAFT_1098515 [Mycena vulgaris]|nr:hypothetical protein DFH09DRAFT_1098515 [Mycena vulgaris]
MPTTSAASPTTPTKLAGAGHGRGHEEAGLGGCEAAESRGMTMDYPSSIQRASERGKGISDVDDAGDAGGTERAGALPQISYEGVRRTRGSFEIKETYGSGMLPMASQTTPTRRAGADHGEGIHGALKEWHIPEWNCGCRSHDSGEATRRQGWAEGTPGPRRGRDGGVTRMSYEGVRRTQGSLNEHHVLVAMQLAAQSSEQYPQAYLPAMEINFLRNQGTHHMRFATDDPSLYPQQFSKTYPHLAVIRRRESNPDLAILWYNPTRDDLVPSSTISKGLGRFVWTKFRKLLNATQSIIARYNLYRHVSEPKAFGRVVQCMRMAVERLQSLPSTFQKLVYAVTLVQRNWLELDALLEYYTVYKPRMEQFGTDNVMYPVAVGCMGAFTTVVDEAQSLFDAGIPYWGMSFLKLWVHSVCEGVVEVEMG